jgi:hypothetical protein
VKYNFYKENLLIQNILKDYTVNGVLKTNIKDSDLNIAAKNFITIIQGNNPSTLIGSIESTDILQNIVYDKIVCSYKNNDEINSILDMYENITLPVSNKIDNKGTFKYKKESLKKMV